MNAGPLDLSGADTKGFDALDAGRYDAEVYEISWDAVKNTDGTGKMPSGTPMLKIQFKVLDPKIDGESLNQDRRVFTQFVIPPKDYDQKKSATMKGMVARFFMALGFEEEAVKSSEFTPDFEALKGTPCVVVLNKYLYPPDPETGEWRNQVKGVKPAGTGVGTSTGLL
jgi:hypothetical protein